VHFLRDGWPTKDAGGWRAFWRERGMRDLTALLAADWSPLVGAPEEMREACAFRIASLLGSRAPRAALAEELGRIRRDELGLPLSPAEDERTADTVASWFTSAAA
jgi:hypothetical protein